MSRCAIAHERDLMQYFARRADGAIILATEADKGKSYLCPECGGPLRARGGDVRKRHFFHLAATNCRQNSKSLAHLMTQIHLQKKLPGSKLEVPIGRRIADLYWPQGKLVYEVQCSPILGSELLARNSDYGALGIRVIWIFHTRRFNRRRITAAEAVLRNQVYFYTDIDAEGRGTIFSQEREIESGRVLRWGRREMANLLQPKKNPDRQVARKRGWYRKFLRRLIEKG
jgi:competence protein CoiA